MIKSAPMTSAPLLKLAVCGMMAAHSAAVLADNSPAAVAVSAEPGANPHGVAMELAKALKPLDTIQAEMRYAFDGSLAKDMQADPDIAEMEADYPGLTQHLLIALKSEIEAQVIRTTPDLWDRLAKIFASSMSATELDQALAYCQHRLCATWQGDR
jgi:hypothetical protein